MIPAIRRDTFDLLRFAFQQVISDPRILQGMDGAKANLDFRVAEDIIRGMLLGIETRLLAKRRDETFEATEPAGVVAYPADWWQAFKARWFPRWALRLWPVIETQIQKSVRRVTNTTYRVCPHVAIRHEPGRSHVHFQWMTESE